MNCPYIKGKTKGHRPFAAKPEGLSERCEQFLCNNLWGTALRESQPLGKTRLSAVCIKIEHHA